MVRLLSNYIPNPTSSLPMNPSNANFLFFLSFFCLCGKPFLLSEFPYLIFISLFHTLIPIAKLPPIEIPFPHIYSNFSTYLAHFSFLPAPSHRHYPVGVLYDLLAEDELPWSITVHFQNFPVDHIMKLGNNSLTRSFYMNSLKESTYVKQNSIKTINDFGIRESDTIWEGLYDGVFEKFWSIASATAPATTAAVPVRILRPNFPIMQFPCSIKSVEGETAPTLASTLTLALPDVPHTIPFSIQGISPPLDTPLSWLYQHLAHPDGFLYIVFKD